MSDNRSRRKLLINCSKELRQNEFDIVKFLCVDIIQASALDRIKNCLDLWTQLERTGDLNLSKYSFLAEILTLAGRIDLAEKLTYDEEFVDSSHISPFRRLLCNIGKHIPEDQLALVKFLFADDVSTAASEMATNIWEFFLLLERNCLLSPTNIDNLDAIVDAIQHESLHSLIDEYKSKNSTSSQQKLLANEFNRCQISASEPSLIQKCIAKSTPPAVSQAASEINNDPTVFDQTERYTIESSPKGFCILINNQMFHLNPGDPKVLNLNERRGSEVDEDELRKVFELLDFKVFSHKNETAEKMKQLFEKYAGEQEMSKADVLVVIILSHGEEKAVYGADSCALKIQELLSFFNAKACPALINKPKLFFMQVCQGNQSQEGIYSGKECLSKPVVMKYLLISKSHPDLFNSIETCVKIHTDCVEDRDELTPKDADFFLGIATVEGYRSFRHVEKGTWFIRCLTDVLRKDAHKDDLESIMTKVKAKVSKFSLFDGTNRWKQMPCIYSTLRKKVFLTPIQKSPKKPF